MKKLVPYAVTVCVLAACSDVPSSTAPSAGPAAVPQGLVRSVAGTPLPGHYIVRFKDSEPSALMRAQSIERTHGGVIERVYSSAIKGAAMQLADAAATALQSDVNVISVEQDQTVSMSTTQANPPSWGLDRIDQRALPLSASYTYSGNGSGVTVYIIDTGINFTHTEFGGRASTGIDEVTSGGTAADCNGHGTHVSGTVGGTTYGVAKGVNLVAVRVLDCSGSGTVSGVIAGVDWVTAHRVLPAAANMSLGGSFSATLNQAVTNSIASGVVYGVAAGNSSGNACLESPSSTANAIVVGAIDITDHFASFSNFGTCVHINAPGVSIKSSWIGSNTATNTISGTSMATPHVVGVSALYLQANPAATPAQVRSALTSNATSAMIIGVPAATPNLLLYTGFITQPPLANFTSNCSALSCAFDGSTTTALPAATYSWTFGDATTGTGKTTSHTYAAASTYSVTLTVTDANGTSSKTKSVSVSATGNQAPVANFTATCSGLGVNQCQMDGSTSTDDVGIVLYTWNWGNGKTESHPTPATKNSWAAPGVYSVTLTVTDGGGLTNSTTKPVTVGAGANQPPTATITAPANGSSTVRGTSVNFAGTGSDPEDGTLTGASLVWSSSLDGQIGTGTSFGTSTLSVGTHTITLTAKDAQGATGTAARTITVTAPVNQAPTATITAPANGSSTVQGTSVSFAGTGSDAEDGALSGASLVWNSSRDGQIGTGTSFSTTTLSVGTHTITLTAKDSQGATGTATRTITVTTPVVNQAPVAKFTWTCTGLNAHQCQLDASTSTDDVGITTYAWNWGNGKGESHSTPTTKNSWAAAGSYSVTLTVTDTGGLTNTIVQTVTVP